MAASAAKLVDIGANLTNRRFQKDLPQVLRRAAEAGVDAILITGTSMRGSRDALQLVHRMQPKSSTTLFSTVGVHPHDAKDFNGANAINEMRELILANPGTVVAVGECGLDFNRDFSPRDVQERVFRAQVELACELQLPLFLHEREAHATFVSVLQPFIDAKRLPPVVVHCFTGSESDLRKYISMGFYIGLTGFVCMDSRGFKLRTMASLIPTDKLLIETDAPFMYPYGNNVKARCEPKDLRAVAQTLAECFRATPDEIAAMTTANTKRFFSLDKHLALRATPPAAAASASNSDGPRSHKKKIASPPALEQKPAAHNQLGEEIGQDEPGLVVLDGGSGEGGGQLLRISVALASVLQKSIRVHSIRANRKVPGLRNQHVHTIQLASNLSPSSALIGAQLNSTEIKYTGAGASTSGGGTFEASSQTGGSVSLMIQGSLPSMVFSAATTTLQLSGGTHAGFSPPVDFMQVPLKQLLARFGVETTLEIKKRGFSMGEIGEVEFRVAPVASRGPLQPIDVSLPSDKFAKLYARVTVFGASTDLQVTGQQYVTSLKRALTASLGSSLSKDTVQEFEILAEAAKPKSNNRHRGRGFKGKPVAAAVGAGAKFEKANVSIMVVAETSTGGLLSVDRSGRDTPDYMALTVSKVLAQYVADGVCMDEHLADNAIVFMTLAAGVSRLRVPAKAARSSQHLETALDVAAKIAGVHVRLEEGETSALVEVHGMGFVAEP